MLEINEILLKVSTDLNNLTDQEYQVIVNYSKAIINKLRYKFNILLSGEDIIGLIHISIMQFNKYYDNSKSKIQPKNYYYTLIYQSMVKTNIKQTEIKNKEFLGIENDYFENI